MAGPGRHRTHAAARAVDVRGRRRTLGTTHQNVRKLLGALADKGLLTLAPSPDDARARAISLTPAALAYFEENEHTGAQLLDTLFDGVPTDDIATCLRVLNAMSINLTGAALTPSDA